MDSLQERPCGHDSRVLVFGVDAADFARIQKFVSDGELPTFARVMKMGKVKVLRSTIPDTTSPSWTSIFTGVDPSYHGIYGFSQPSGHEVLLTSAASIRSPAVWNLMDPRCQKVIINVPNTHPVQRINGCMIPEIGESVFPDKLEPYLLRLGYVRFEPQGKDLRSLCKSVEVRCEVTAHLLQEYQWCLAAVVFREADWANHFFPTSTKKILAVYKALDNALERILQSVTVDPRTSVLIVSDHGSTLSRRLFFINHWLIKIGLLNVKEVRGTLVSRLYGTLMRVSPRFALIVDRLVPRELLMRSLIRSDFGTSELIDYSGLYSAGHDAGRYYRLYLTEDRRRDYDSFLRKLAAEAKTAFDDRLNKNPIINVLQKRDIYKGVHSLAGPDFVLELDQNYWGSRMIFDPSCVFAPVHAGTHRPEGIFIGYNLNEDVLPSSDTISVCDIVPIILRTLRP